MRHHETTECHVLWVHTHCDLFWPGTGRSRNASIYLCQISQAVYRSRETMIYPDILRMPSQSYIRLARPVPSGIYSRVSIILYWRCASSTILQSTRELVSLYIESTRPLQTYDTCMRGPWSGICFIMLSQSQIEAVRKNQCHSRSGSSLIIIVIWGQISFAWNSQSLLCIDLNALRNPAQTRQGRCLTTSSGARSHWAAWAARMRWIMRVMKVRD